MHYFFWQKKLEWSFKHCKFCPPPFRLQDMLEERIDPGCHPIRGGTEVIVAGGGDPYWWSERSRTVQARGWDKSKWATSKTE